MPKSKAQKNSDLEELTGKLKSARGVVLTDYRGTTVKEMDKFRRTLGKENVFSKVYKLTLVKRALSAAGIESKDLDYKTPVILSFSQEDETAAARGIKNLAKDIKTLAILEGVVGGKFIPKAEVMALADLPSKDQLRGMFVGTIKAPITGLVNVLAGNLRGLMNVLNALAAK